MRFLAFFLVLPLMAAVQGTVTNQTTGQPQAGAVVSLMNLGAGMSPVGAARTDPQGAFSINAELQPGSPFLVQVIHQGVVYNKMLPQGSAASGIGIDVFDSAAKVPDAKVAQHMVLLEPSGTELVVNQSIIFNNPSKTTYNDPEGTLKVWVPSEVNVPVQVRIMAAGGMPINRQAEKSKNPNVYVLKYPVKPGETRFDVFYAMPAGEGAKFTGKVLHGGGPVRFIAPQGVTFESEALASLGAEPETRANVYELKGTEYAMTVQGTGSLRSSQAAAQPSAPEEDPAGGIDIVKPRIYQRAAWIIGISMAMLMVGLAMLWRAPAK